MSDELEIPGIAGETTAGLLTTFSNELLHMDAPVLAD